ncbi:MAG: D-2-hydroxyacid dehydrogenase [Acidaminococcus sp.]|jgi:phosphoglycerate dehydrogenase-like enzyme|nr:D-2-hydroxyacid dehydrogenase [Acidaminococcus sp.]MCI2100135.1 D-2-hydroxyacid dehydrogenase [Acidaminococcus sp.]MCI2114454.1 D-2-hydroxyacid dehydrogenase [Acidaminococcus sp.]MCI2116389.1 D-2-hydroxyacid dehydrogenase [Acidaminococcus sp.]
MKIAVVMKVLDKHKKALEAALPNADFYYGKDPDKLAEAEVIIGNIKPPMAATLPKLKWLQLETAGANTYTSEPTFPKDLLLTNATGGYGINIAEHILGLLLPMMKNFYKYDANQKQGLWHDEGTVHTIYGSTAVIVGFGNIGRRTGLLLKTMGAHVIGIRRRSTAPLPEADEMGTLDDLDKYLARADIVISALPDTPQTEHIYNKERFAAMKEGAFFINVGRGVAVVQEELMEALKSGHLNGAAIDVATPEPLPQDSPLWKTPNLHITPHVSGGFHAQITWDRIVDIACDNLKRYAAGQPLENIVDRKTGYKK